MFLLLILLMYKWQIVNLYTFKNFSRIFRKKSKKARFFRIVGKLMFSSCLKLRHRASAKTQKPDQNPQKCSRNAWSLFRKTNVGSRRHFFLSPFCTFFCFCQPNAPEPAAWAARGFSMSYSTSGLTAPIDAALLPVFHKRMQGSAIYLWRPLQIPQLSQINGP